MVLTKIRRKHDRLMKPDLGKKTPEFGSLVFFEIAYNDGLEQYLTSSRGETHEK